MEAKDHNYGVAGDDKIGDRAVEDEVVGGQGAVTMSTQ